MKKKGQCDALDKIRLFLKLVFPCGLCPRTLSVFSHHPLPTSNDKESKLNKMIMEVKNVQIKKSSVLTL